MNLNNKIHYYGWNHISKTVQFIAKRYNVLIIDYVDYYFINENNKIITQKWFGFIHHTSSNFSCNNICNLFNNNIFLNSLKNCKGLIVLSYYNKNNVDLELKKLYLNINVFVIYHPTPPTFNYTFQLNLFNESKLIFNIGGWLRNPYSIFCNNFLYNNILLNKIKLKGKNMDEYFPLNIKDIDMIDNYHEKIIGNNNAYNNIFCRDITTMNYYFKYLIEYWKDLYFSKNLSNEEINEILIVNRNSVEIIEYLENEIYIKYFTKSIIYCDFLDCSASNTIIECISCCTPIIVPRLPAIVEYLGNDYPLYIDKLKKEKNNYILTNDLIINANSYLLKLKKSNKFTLSNFINNLEQIIIENI